MKQSIDVIEERVCNLKKQNDIDHATILVRIQELNDKIDGVFVTKERFQPVEKIAYGLISIVVITVLGAVIKLVVK